MSKGKLAAVLGGLLLAATSADAQDATQIVQQAYGACKTQHAELEQKYGRTLSQGDMLYCSCIAGAGAMGRATRQGASDATLERVADACQTLRKTE